MNRFNCYLCYSVAEKAEKVYENLQNLAEMRVHINFFEFVIDPKSFSNTVKHIFLTSFLVKRKEATIYLRDEIPHIKPGSHSTGNRKGGEERNRKSSQIILTITKGQWKELTELLGIEKSILQL